MRCGLIGSGNVAHALGRHWADQIGWHAHWNRSETSIFPDVPFSRDAKGWDVAVLAVADDALEAVSAELPIHVLRVHLSGAKPLNAVLQEGARGAVIWPVCSIRKEQMPDWSAVHWAVEASDENALEWALNAIRALGGMPHAISSEQRIRAHIAAVFAANFSNLMLAEASKLVHPTGLPWAAVHALAQGVLERATTEAGAQLITGPAARGDEATLNVHRALLAEESDLASLYEALTLRIQQRS
jgi:predicted short-subunit dehydrogenase-like oxidoreductase (DUF2520 family)